MNQKLVTMAAAVIAMGCLSLTAYMAYATHSATNAPVRTIPYQGTLAENQQPVTGQEMLIFRLYDDASCQTSFWDEQQTVDVVDGRFSTQLGTVDVFERHSANDPFAKPEIFLGIEIVGATALVGCQKIIAAPRAVVADNGVPPGTVVSFAGSATDVPAGWLLCDGQALSSNAYAQLFGAIGTAWGDGTDNCAAGGCDFNLPDMRGYFLRGVDQGAGRDPNAAGRLSLLSGGNVSDAVGSRQGVEIQTHSHSVSDPGHSHGITDPGHRHGIVWGQNIAAGASVHERSGILNTSGTPQTLNATTGISIRSAQSRVTVNARAGSETRPKNVSVNYIIKY